MSWHYKPACISKCRATFSAWSWRKLRAKADMLSKRSFTVTSPLRLKLQSFCSGWRKDIRHCMILLRHYMRKKDHACRMSIYIDVDMHRPSACYRACPRDHHQPQLVQFMCCTVEAFGSPQLLLAKSVHLSKPHIPVG